MMNMAHKVLSGPKLVVSFRTASLQFMVESRSSAPTLTVNTFIMCSFHTIYGNPY